MKERFVPPPHYPPDSFAHGLRFYARLITDFQVLTVYRAMRSFLPPLDGKVLDIGCGQSPYRFLIKAGSEYIGVDVVQAKDFGYENGNALLFDGKHLPFEEGSIDHLICTEMLEHTHEPQALISEMYRVLRRDGDGVITIPWSARYHYLPHDYYRFTPSALHLMFQSFRKVAIEPRGTDFVVICSKLLTAYCRLLFKPGDGRIIRILLAVILAPLVLVILLLGHLSLAFKLGAEEDPLGYTVRVQK